MLQVLLLTTEMVADAAVLDYDTDAVLTASNILAKLKVLMEQCLTLCCLAKPTWRC
jgi:hypothetical protein